VEAQLHVFLTSALDGCEWSVSRPGRFTPRERAPGTHWIGGWVGPRAILDAMVKRKLPSPRREWNPRTSIVQLILQRYTDWAITALSVLRYFSIVLHYWLTPGSRFLLQKLINFQVCQEISCLLWNPKFHYLIHKNPPLDSIPRQLTRPQIHTLFL
jgi:hypothetical protein